MVNPTVFKWNPNTRKHEYWTAINKHDMLISIIKHERWLNGEWINAEQLRMTNCIIHSMDMRSRDLRAVEFVNCEIYDVDFTDTNLSYGIFKNTSIQSCNLSGTNFTGADLRHTHIRSYSIPTDMVNFSEADLSYALIEGGESCSILKQVDLAGTKLEGTSIKVYKGEIGNAIFSKTEGIITLENHMPMKVRELLVKVPAMFGGMEISVEARVEYVKFFKECLREMDTV